MLKIGESLTTLTSLHPHALVRLLDSHFFNLLLFVVSPSVAVLLPSPLFFSSIPWLDDDQQCVDSDLAQWCGLQCMNCGRYCRIDPDGNVNTSPTGADEVFEAALGKFIWYYGNDSTDAIAGAPVLHPPGGRENNYRLWFDYTVYRAQTLNCIKQVPYSQECSKTAMTSVGIPGADVEIIFSYLTSSISYTSNTTVPILETELNWYEEYLPLQSPWLVINDAPYFGSYSCPTPLSEETCGTLAALCAGFNSSLPMPDICAGCVRDACGVCNGDATDSSQCSSGSFPTGAVIGVVIVCCVLIGGGVYWYMKRQNNKMRDDIDSLLKQYLPLEGSSAGASTSANGGKHASPNGRTEPNTNLRLIGNLDTTSDEPTDL